MVDYKSKYLEIKLKYINAKNKLKGGMDQSALDESVNLENLNRDIQEIDMLLEELSPSPPPYSSSIVTTNPSEETETLPPPPANTTSDIPPFFSDRSTPILPTCPRCGEPGCGTSCSYLGTPPPARRGRGGNVERLQETFDTLKEESARFRMIMYGWSRNNNINNSNDFLNLDDSQKWSLVCDVKEIQDRYIIESSGLSWDKNRYESTCLSKITDLQKFYLYLIRFDEYDTFFLNYGVHNGEDLRWLDNNKKRELLDLINDEEKRQEIAILLY